VTGVAAVVWADVIGSEVRVDDKANIFERCTQVRQFFGLPELVFKGLCVGCGVRGGQTRDVRLLDRRRATPLVGQAPVSLKLGLPHVGDSKAVAAGMGQNLDQDKAEATPIA